MMIDMGISMTWKDDINNMDKLDKLKGARAAPIHFRDRGRRSAIEASIFNPSNRRFYKRFY